MVMLPLRGRTYAAPPAAARCPASWRHGAESAPVAIRAALGLIYCPESFPEDDASPSQYAARDRALDHGRTRIPHDLLRAAPRALAPARHSRPVAGGARDRVLGLARGSRDHHKRRAGRSLR